MWLLGVMLPALVGGGLSSQERVELAGRIEQLDGRIPQLMEQGRVPGLAVAVVAEGRTVFCRGYGVRSGSGDPVDEDTVFEAASLSKPVFAYAVMMLVDRGTLDLDKPLAEYVSYEDQVRDPRVGRITARHVLSHTTGFPNWRRGRPLAIEHDPGTKFQYSGEGFVYLQKVVEYLAGEPLHEYMRKTVFIPLDMSRSSYVYRDDFDANVAAGFGTDRAARPKRRPAEGNSAWSLHTTARDFARFLVAILDGSGLSEQAAGDMVTSQVAVEPGVAWGLGWGLEDGPLGPALWHWGHNSGYRCYATAIPSWSLGMVFFTNSDDGMLLLGALVNGAMGDGDHPALRHLDYESFDSPRYIVQTTIEQVTIDQGAAAGIARYRLLKQQHPAEAFDENLLNRLGYKLLARHRVEEAIEIFKLNVAEYPEAFNPYDSLGEAYMIDGRFELAIKYYQLSIDLNPGNANGIRMIRRIHRQRDAGLEVH